MKTKYILAALIVVAAGIGTWIYFYRYATISGWCRLPKGGLIMVGERGLEDDERSGDRWRVICTDDGLVREGQYYTTVQPTSP